MSIESDCSVIQEVIEELVKCTNCKVLRKQENYIGKKGNIVKRCIKCREKDAKQKKKPDVIEKRNKRQNEKKYYKAYRDKKRDKDEDAYLKHNAEIYKNWRENNKEHLTKWRTQNFNSRFSSIKQQAKKKGIIWNANLTDEICYKMMTSKCFYCDFISDETLNGIDRMDNFGNYELNNTVSCCKTCNFIKCCLDPDTFVKRCQHISKHFCGEGIFNYDLWPDTKPSVYGMYKNRASKKEIEFNITKEQYDKYIIESCYYCGKKSSDTHINGIDRKNNSIGYNESNCVTCCSQCNYMKGYLGNDEFISACKKISHHSKFIKLPNINKCYNVISKRVKKEVVK